ncbi:MAG: PilZ domain-containing protein [Polyangiales bacterium]
MIGWRAQTARRVEETSMSYSGAAQAAQAREDLGAALAALQEDNNVPQDVMAVAQNIAKAVGALFEAGQASSEPDGKGCVRSALDSLSQTLALLQDVRGQHKAIGRATESIARTMSVLYPLTNLPSHPPEAPSIASASKPAAAENKDAAQSQGSASDSVAPTAADKPTTTAKKADDPERAEAAVAAPQTDAAAAGSAAAGPAAAEPGPSAQFAAAQPEPAKGGGASVAADQAEPAKGGGASAAATQSVLPGQRQAVEANIGAATQSNFFVGFSGEIADGGVFLATYESFERGTPIDLVVTLPGGYEFKVPGVVRFVRDPHDFVDGQPGMGIAFETLPQEHRELVLRFIRKRAPMFYDD